MGLPGLFFALPFSALAVASCQAIIVSNQTVPLEELINKLKKQKNKISKGMAIDDGPKKALLADCNKLIKEKENVQTIMPKNARREEGGEDPSGTKRDSDSTIDQGPCADLPDPDTENLDKDQLEREKSKAEKESKKLDMTLVQNRHTNPTINETEERKKNICDDKVREYEKALSAIETCKETTDKVEEILNNFRKSCADFVGGQTKCSSAIEACDKCPDEENFGDYDCVAVHRQTKCPALSGKELEEAKEKRKELEEDIKTLKGDIEDKEKDHLSKEDGLKDAIAEVEESFIKLTRELETNTETAKEDLEKGLKKAKAQIDGGLAKQLSAIQQQIDSALKIAHSFENAIYKANREYRKERRQITMECEKQAKVELADFRRRRRAAIVTGSLNYSLSSFLQKGRKSFAEKDHARFQRYHNRCLKRRKQDFKDVRTDYQQKLRVIDQQKEQYLEIVRKQKQQLALLNQKAQQAGNDLLKDYTTQMDRILTRHNKLYERAVQDYNKKKNLIASQTKNLAVLDHQKQRTVQTLKSKQGTMLREEEIIIYLKNKGVSSEDSSKEAFKEAASDLAKLKNSLTTAEGECNCDLTTSDSDEENPPKPRNPNQKRQCSDLKKARASTEESSSEDNGYTPSFINNGNGKH